MPTITSSYTPQPVGEQVLRTNRAPNPRAVVNTTGWGTANGTLTQHLNDGYPGVKVSAATTNVSVLGESGTDTAGEYWAASVMLAPLNASAVGKTVEVQGHDGTSYYTPRQSVTLPELGSTVPVDLPNRNVLVGPTPRLYVYPVAFDGTEELFITDVLSCQVSAEGETAGAFFAGDSPDEPPITYRFTGTPNASPSEEVLTLYDSVTETTPELVLGYQTQREARTVVHRVLDRVDPDVSLRPAGMRSGTLDLFYLTEQEAYDAEVMHTMPARFTFTEDDRPTASMTYVVADGRIQRRLDDATRRRWVVSVPFVEVQP